MNPDRSKAPIFEMVDTLFKSWWTLVAGLCVGLAGAIAALHHLPEVYAAATKIRFAPQSISEDMVRSAINDDMSRRLLEIEEAVLSRDYMDKLIEHNFGRPETEEQRQALMRILQSRVDVKHQPGTRLASLIYRDTDPQRAADVINHLTDLYIEQNKEFRASQAERTRSDFEQRAAEAKDTLDAIDQEMNRFMTQHRLETGDFLDANLKLLESRRTDLERSIRDQDAARTSLQILEQRRDQGHWSVDVSDVATGDPRLRRIRQVQTELADLQVRYSKDHPAVTRKQRELDELIASAGDAQGATEDDRPAVPTLPVDPALEALLRQIEGKNRELSELRADQQALQREIADLEGRINRTPAIQDQANDLKARRAEAEAIYNDYRKKLDRARESEFLETTEQAQRLEIVERAVVPFRPVSPNPVQVYCIGIAAGLLLFVGPLLLRTVLNPVVSSEAGLRALIEVPVLVAIPRVVTVDTAGVERRRLFKNLGLSLVSSAVLVVVMFALGQS